MKKHFLAGFAALLFVTCIGCAPDMMKSSSLMMQDDSRWWPVQKAPAGVVRTIPIDDFETEAGPGGERMSGWLGTTHILVQSVAGLAAQAVNEGRCDEMVWITHTSGMYPYWYTKMVERLGFEERGVFTPWQLVERYRKMGVIKGYILYSYDDSEGRLYEKRDNIDPSSNTATVVAGLMQGILIEESQEEKAVAMGLPKLFDTRGRTSEWIFNHFEKMLNRRLLLTIDPKAPHNRAMAIAHKSMVIYGTDEPLGRILEWMEPPSPVMGWNCGNEDQHTRPLTECGHFQTASNWAVNLPLLSAGTQDMDLQKVKTVDPRMIDRDSGNHFTTIEMSDGDNLQWMLGNFCDNESYWANPYNGDFGIGWTVCVGHLAQVAPEVLEYIAATQRPKATIIEHGAGYYYPDEFASKRADRWEVLRHHARRINSQLEKSGVKVFSFICQDVKSPEAMKAYQIYAEELETITGMIAFQYYPYDGGDGEIFWFRNSKGIEIPVVTAKFSTWTNARWPRGGTPAKVARLTNEYARQMQAEGKKSFSVTAAHAWSKFLYAPGYDETAENTSRDPEEARLQEGQRGLTPLKWLVERLDPTVEVVSPEELLWRVRMEYRPEQTRKVIAAMGKD